MIKFGMFLLLYSLMKVVRVMTAATVWMAAALLVCQTGGFRTWRWNLGMLILVPAACFTGYSEIFFTGGCFRFTNWMQATVTEEMAVFYFAIACLLAARALYLHVRLRRRISDMQRLSPAEYSDAVRESLRLPGKSGPINVYLTKESCSPFAGGILRPYIVVPQMLKNSLSQEEFAAVLYHEALHIRQGHILLLTVYAWLKICWWVHPLIYILDAKLRENLEYSSDEGSVLLGSLSVYEYAGLILKTVRFRQQKVLVQTGITTFSEQCFAALKKRLERLGQVKKDSSALRSYQKKKQVFAAVTAAAFLIGMAVILATSLPRYTRLEKISAYDEKLHPLTFDLEQEGFQAQIIDGKIQISPQELSRFSETYDLHGEYVIFSYDTIMKVPGIGGLGQAAMVRTTDASDVFLLGRMEWMDQLKLFILKYLV